MKQIITNQSSAPRAASGSGKQPLVASGNNSQRKHIGIHHVGLVAQDLVAAADFYSKVFEMQIVGGSSADYELGETIFLTSRPESESHEIALFANPDLRHTAFKVASLGDLRRFHQRCLDLGVVIKMALNHRSSFALYIEDPSGNLIEIYWDTGMDCRQPHVEPLDLTKSEEQLLAQLGRSSL